MTRNEERTQPPLEENLPWQLPPLLAGAVYRAKQILPVGVWRTITTPYWWWYNRGQHQLAGVLSGDLRASRQALHALQDSHSGERCFILGNGPSLRKTDLSPLRNEFTFGLNRIYLLFPELGFATSCLVSINTLVIQQCVEELRKLAVPKFVTWRARPWLRGVPDTIFLDTDYTPPETFAADVTGRVFEGSTVTYVALQLAFHMGFRQVVLVGVDHRFGAQGRPNATITSTAGDMDHFSPDYFGPGFRWQLPDLEASERSYRLARQAYENAGRQVIDATVDGALDVFPKANYGELF